MNLADIERLSFTYKDYEYLLESILYSKYKVSLFEFDDESSDNLFLRHDIDKSVEKALEIASIEHEKKIVSSFFFLTRSPLYSVLEPNTIKIIKEIAKMGHSIGLHIDVARIKSTSIDSTKIDIQSIVYHEFEIMNTVLGEILSNVFSFHNPSKDILKKPSFNQGLICTYGNNFMMPKTKYISDSNSFWREGNPIPNIKKKKWDRLQILTHPIWWTQDKPLNIIKLLKKTISNRNIELESYLMHSNSVYANSKKNI